jgi:hypothetical protein
MPLFLGGAVMPRNLIVPARALAPLCLAAAVLAGGCAPSVVCGDGTRQENGRCVPASLARCGAGTKLVGVDCVPDTDVVCTGRSTAVGGTCVPDEALTCGAGTEERDGACVVLDPMRRVTDGELPEPNGAVSSMKRFNLPAVGAAPAVLGGVLGPVVRNEADVDFFVFEGRRLQRLRITAFGIGAPVVGVVLQPASAELKFARYALTLDARGGSREVVIPADGDWVLLVTDQAQLTGGVPTGSEEFTYTIDVAQVALPAALPAPAEGSTSGRFVDLDSYAVTASAAQPLYDILLPEDESAPFPGNRALWALGPDGTLLLNAIDTVDPDWGFSLPIPAATRIVLPPGQSTIFVDYVYEFGGREARYDLGLRQVPVANLGALATPRTDSSVLDDAEGKVYSLEITGAALLDVSLVLPSGSHVDPLIELRDARYALVGSAQKTTFQRYLGAAEAGRYYVVVKDRVVRATDTNLAYDLTAALSPVRQLGPVGIGRMESFEGTLEDGAHQWFAVVAGNDAALSVSVVPGALVAATLELWPPTFNAEIATAGSAVRGTRVEIPGVIVQAGGVLLAKVKGDAGAFSIDAAAAETIATFEAEPNDTSETATQLSFDASDHALGVGFMETNSEVDYFQITVAGSSSVTLAAETKRGIWNGLIDTRLSLVRPDGTTIASNDDIGGGNDLSRISTSVTPGTYLLVVRRWSPFAPSDGTDYLLDVQLTR